MRLVGVLVPSTYRRREGRKWTPLCDGYVTNPPVYWVSASIRTMLFVPFPSMSKLD